MKLTLANSAQGLVIAPKSVLAEAQDVFTQIGASVETAALEAVRKIEARAGSGKTYLFLAFYVTRAFPRHAFSETLRRLKQFQNAHFLVYVAYHQLDLAFTLGKTLGRELGEGAEIASTVREAKQLLKSWDAVVSDPPYSRQGTDLLEARKRLGLTQEQMASALNVTARTLQNWEQNIGTSQMERKTRLRTRHSRTKGLSTSSSRGRYVISSSSSKDCARVSPFEPYRRGTDGSSQTD
jgi:DNA-binding transcriptional regulator YiaG